MKTSRPLLVCTVTAVLSFVLGIAFQKNGESIMSKTFYLKTTAPMLLGTEGEVQDFHVLPAGAALYKVKEFPEGHTTYLAYINIKGPFAAERIEANEANLIDPMWAMRVRSQTSSDWGIRLLIAGRSSVAVPSTLRSVVSLWH